MKILLICFILYSLLVFSIGELVPVPRGGFYQKECVHEVPDGSSVFVDENNQINVHSRDGNIQKISQCDHSVKKTESKRLPSGWQLYTYTFGESYTEMNATWIVPSDPIILDDGQTVFLLYWL